MYLDTRFSGRRYQVNLSLFLFRSRSSSSLTTISKVLILGLRPSIKEVSHSFMIFNTYPMSTVFLLLSIGKFQWNLTPPPFPLPNYWRLLWKAPMWLVPPLYTAATMHTSLVNSHWFLYSAKGWCIGAVKLADGRYAFSVPSWGRIEKWGKRKRCQSEF